MLLTTEEVRDLTGYEKPSAQSKWMRENGITHFINGQNVVKVTWEAVNNPKVLLKGTEPRFDYVA